MVPRSRFLIGLVVAISIGVFFCTTFEGLDTFVFPRSLLRAYDFLEVRSSRLLFFLVRVRTKCFSDGFLRRRVGPFLMPPVLALVDGIHVACWYSSFGFKFHLFPTLRGQLDNVDRYVMFEHSLFFLGVRLLCYFVYEGFRIFLSFRRTRSNQRC